jgi:predicted PurR-regulated permease PerM
MFIAFVGVWYILSPFMNPIIVGILVSSVFYPLHRIVDKWCKQKALLSAALSTTLVVAFFIIPAIIFTSMVIKQGIYVVNQGLERLEESNITSDHATTPLKDNFIEKFFNKNKDKAWVIKLRQEFDITPKVIDEMYKKFLQYATSSLSDISKSLSSKLLNIFTIAGGMVFDFFITMLVIFYLFMNGQKVMMRLLHLSPLAAKDEKLFTDKIRVVTKSAFQGTFLTAVCHGLVSFVSLSIVGLPAIFLATLVAISSSVPVVGTALVLGPIIIYLYTIGKIGSIVFIIIWALIFNNIVDYVIRPMLMKDGAESSSVLFLFSIMGGVAKFGIVGFLYGPIIFAIMTVVLEIYSERNKEFLNQQDGEIERIDVKCS